MINIDKYAYSSKLKRKAPLPKFLFAVLTMGVCFWANRIPVSILVIFIMIGVTVRQGGMPLSLFLKLLGIPVSFLVIGVLTIAVSFSANRNLFICSIPISGLYIGTSKVGIVNAARLFFKALGAVSCLYYLSLSTPMIDLMAVLRRLKVPKLIIELMGLIYRFIFVLLETAEKMVIAQNSRLGYSSLSSGYRSLGAVASTLFIRVYKRSDELYTALEARGYDGELNVMEETYETRRIEYIMPILINLFLIAVGLTLRQFMGGLL